MGTDVLSGQGKAIILKTGQNTFFGDVAKKASTKRGDTSFEEGMSKISKLILRMVLVLFPVVFLINGVTKGEWTQAFFFAIAVAVGLTPEMLPMIVTSNLAKGSVSLSKKKIIVKELPAIQNLGGMNVLCTDKTGTITEDRVVVVKHVNPSGVTDEHVLDMAFLNSYYQTGWKNLMDHAVIDFYEDHQEKTDASDKIDDSLKKLKKIDEIPFDFNRRRLTVVVDEGDRHYMITKGAVEEMDQVCDYVETNGEQIQITPDIRKKLFEINREMNEAGMRVITVAYRKDVHKSAVYTIADEKNMVLLGFIGFLDPAKQSAVTAISQLHEHGVQVKVLTGDNEIVAKKVCGDVGIPVDEFLVGSEVEKMTDEQLSEKVETVNLFAKLAPMQKSRIIASLREKGNTVGFMGDGINDAPALREADVGISVDTAADITKDASSVILLEKSLNVLEDSVVEGRKVFINMMKYIEITISSNFGNVFSVLVASAFLPFLPMLSIQLLIQNLVYDIAQLSIPFDNVDESDVIRPVSWNTKNLFRFTVMLGPVSSIFDICIFLVMWFFYGANTPAEQGLFQSGWFMVGLATQTIVVLLIRTKKIPMIESRPSLPVMLASVCAILVGVLIVSTPGLQAAFNFSPLPGSYWLWWIAIVVGYSIVMEGAKRLYLRHLPV